MSRFLHSRSARRCYARDFRDLRDLIPPPAQAGVTVWCVAVSALCLAGLAAMIWEPFWSAWQ